MRRAPVDASGPPPARMRAVSTGGYVGLAGWYRPASVYFAFAIRLGGRPLALRLWP